MQTNNIAANITLRPNELVFCTSSIECSNIPYVICLVISLWSGTKSGTGDIDRILASAAVFWTIVNQIIWLINFVLFPDLDAKINFRTVFQNYEICYVYFQSQQPPVGLEVRRLAAWEKRSGRGQGQSLVLIRPPVERPSSNLHLKPSFSENVKRQLNWTVT